MHLEHGKKYIIRCSDEQEWMEVIEYLKDNGLQVGGKVPNKFVNYAQDCFRICFKGDMIDDWGFASFSFYRDRHQYDGYIFTDFSDLTDQTADFANIISAFDELM